MSDWHTVTVTLDLRRLAELLSAEGEVGRLNRRMADLAESRGRLRSDADAYEAEANRWRGETCLLRADLAAAREEARTLALEVTELREALATRPAAEPCTGSMVRLSPPEAADALEVLRANASGLVVPADELVRLPTLGAAMVKLSRLARGQGAGDVSSAARSEYAEALREALMGSEVTG